MTTVQECAASELVAGDLLLVATIAGASPERITAVTGYCLAGLADVVAPTHVEVLLEDGSARQLFADELVRVTAREPVLAA